MPKKDENLRSRFFEFRNSDEATKESVYLSNAIQISQYVEKTPNIETIKRDFSAGIKSAKYKELEATHKKRTMGAILYGKLALDDYIKNPLKTTSEEKILLTDLSTIIGNLYGAPQESIGIKIAALFVKSKQWLNDYALTTANKEEAHKLCLTLYTMITCLKIKIKELNWMQLELAKNRLGGENELTKVVDEMENLLTLAEKKAEALEKQPSEKNTAEQGKTKSMQDHFNERYSAIIDKESENPVIQLNILKADVTQVTTDITELQTNRQELEQLEGTLNSLESLLNAANENDTRTTGRAYFSDFLQANKTQVDVLLAHLPLVKKEQFLQDIKPIDNPIVTQSTKAALLGVMSWIASPATILARAITPQIIKDTLSAVIPDTQDSHCKSKLKTLVTETVTSLKETVKERKQKIATLEAALAGGNVELQKLIENADPQALQELVTANAVTAQLTEKYSEVATPIQALGEKLATIKSLHTDVTDFIAQNDKITKKLSDWFSRFKDWFSTKSSSPTQSLSKRITELKDMQEELTKMKSDHEQRIENQKAIFNSNPNISVTIKKKLNQQLEGFPKQVVVSSIPSEKISSKHFNNIKQRMMELKNNIQPLAVNKDEDSHLSQQS